MRLMNQFIYFLKAFQKMIDFKLLRCINCGYKTALMQEMIIFVNKLLDFLYLKIYV